MSNKQLILNKYPSFSISDTDKAIIFDIHNLNFEIMDMINNSGLAIIPFQQNNKNLIIGPLFTNFTNGCPLCCKQKDILSFGIIDKSTLQLDNILYFVRKFFDKMKDQNVIYLQHEVEEIYFTKFVPLGDCEFCTKLRVKINPCYNSNINKITQKQVVSSDNGLRIKTPDSLLDLLSEYIGPRSILSNLSIDQSSSPIFVAHAQILQKNWEHGDIYSAGKGKNIKQAAISAVGEGLERYIASMQSNFYQIVSSEVNLSNKYFLSPEELGYPSQPGIPYIYKYKRSSNYEWIEGYDLTNNKIILLPSNLVFFPYAPQKKEMYFSISTTTGLAGGSCLEEAILQGLLECIERDGYWFTMRTQMNMPDLFLDNLHEMLPISDINNATFHFKDLTNDTTIPNVHALRVSNKIPAYSHGSGAHFVKKLAIERSLTEVIQVKKDLEIFISHINEDKISKESTHYKWCFPENIDEILHLKNKKSTNYLNENSPSNVFNGTINQALQNAVKIIYSSIGARVIFVDLSLPDIPYKVVRVIIDKIGIIDDFYLTNNFRFKEIASFFSFKGDLYRYKKDIFS